MPPPVAVIIPTYNRAHCVGEAIQSVLTQTVPADEIIIMDDRSTDNTTEVLAAFSDRITVIRQPNGGVSVGGMVAAEERSDITNGASNQILGNVLIKGIPNVWQIWFKLPSGGRLRCAATNMRILGGVLKLASTRLWIRHYEYLTYIIFPQFYG